MLISRCLVVLTFAAACLGATRLAQPCEQDDERVMWRVLFERDVSSFCDHVFARQSGDGGHGAGSQGFLVSDSIHGGAIMAAIDGHGATIYEPSADESLPDEARVMPALGVFVGVGVPPSAGSGPYDDLRMTFTLEDGTVRTVAPGAGGGPTMLFQSPSGVAMNDIESIALHVDTTADWAK